MYFIYGVFANDSGLPIYIGMGKKHRLDRLISNTHHYNSRLVEFCVSNYYTKKAIMVFDCHKKAKRMEYYLTQINFEAGACEFNFKAGDKWIKKGRIYIDKHDRKFNGVSAAAKHYGVHRDTIRVWARDNKDGWHFRQR